MLKKSITFENLDGDEVTEVFYFHLSQAELVKMKLSHGGDIEGYFRKILQEQNAEKIIAAFDEIILSTVGERSPDGKRFVKDNGRIAAEFKETDAYSVLFTELLSEDGKNFQAFFTAVVPNKLQEKVEENLKLQERIGQATERIQAGDTDLKEHLTTRVEQIVKAKELEAATDDMPWVVEKRNPTQQELLNMGPELFQRWMDASKK